MRRAALLLASVLVLAACSGSDDPGPEPALPIPTTARPATTTSTTLPVETVLAAGDIASCASGGDEATANLLDARPNALIMTLGDNVTDNGTAAEFANCYDPSWGRHKGRTRPALGDREYGVFRAGGYFGAFGSAAGEAPLGWYSYDLGTWHIIVMNSNCEVVGCALGGSQETWLRQDMGANPRACTLAVLHHPRWSSGTTHGPTPAVAPLYQALHDAGVDVLLSAHERNYERFPPLDPAGNFDPLRGVRQFVAGTGGRGHQPFGPPQFGSQVRNDNTFGLLVLTLRPTSYDWQFVPEAGKTFTDAGSSPCH
jgi:hypothetical protein